MNVVGLEHWNVEAAKEIKRVKQMKGKGECDYVRTWNETRAEKPRKNDFYSNDRLTYLTTRKTAEKLEAAGIHTIANLRGIRQSDIAMCAKQSGITAARIRSLQKRARGCLRGSAPQVVDHRQADNPYKSLYGSSWRMKVSRKIHKICVTHLVEHMITESRRIIGSDDFYIYHDALTMMTSAKCKQWMSEKGYWKHWLLPVNGLNDDIKGYGCRPVGNSPELMPLDCSLFADLKNAIIRHISVTANLRKEDPRKFSLTTPKRAYRAFMRVLDPTLGVNSRGELVQKYRNQAAFGTPSRARICEDINKCYGKRKDGKPNHLFRIRDALGVVVPGIVENITKKDPDMQLLPPHNTEIIASWYLQNIAIDIASFVAKEGTTSVANLARKFDLPVDFLWRVLKQKVSLESDAIIKGTITTSGKIFTEAHMRRVKARARGLFRACTFPVSVVSVASNLGVERETVSKILTDLIASKELSGSVRHSIFQPSIFDIARRQQVQTFFETRKYCPYKLAQQLSIKRNQLAQFLEPNDVISLSSCVIDRRVVTDAEAAIVEVIDDKSSAGFVRTSPLFPSELDDDDVSRCVEQLKVCEGSWRSGKSKGRAFTCCGGGYIVSCALLDLIVEAFVSREREIIANQASTKSADVLSEVTDADSGDVAPSCKENTIDDDESAYVIVSTSSSHDERSLGGERPKKRKAKKKKKKKKEKGKREVQTDSDDDYETDRGNGKRGRKSKARKQNAKMKKKGRRRGREKDHDSDDGSDDDDTNSSKDRRSRKSNVTERKCKETTTRKNGPSPSAKWLSAMRRDKTTTNDVIASISPALIADEHKECLSTILRLVLPYAAAQCVALREDAARSVYRESIDSQRRIRSVAEKRYADVWEDVMLGVKGIDGFISLMDDDDDAKSDMRVKLEKALFTRGGGEECAACIIVAVALQSGVPLPSEARTESGVPMVDANVRADLAIGVGKCDPSVGKTLHNLSKASRRDRPNVCAMIDAVNDLKSNSGCYVRPPDLTRRREKQIYHVRKKELDKRIRAAAPTDKEDFVSAIVRLALLRAKSPLLLARMERDVALECVEVVRSCSKKPLWGAGRSEKVIGFFSKIGDDAKDSSSISQDEDSQFLLTFDAIFE
eukprot:g2550.t1